MIGVPSGSANSGVSLDVAVNELFVTLISGSDTTATLTLRTIKFSSDEVVGGVPGVALALCPAVGAHGSGAPHLSSRRRFCRARNSANIDERACATYAVGPCMRENQRSRSQTPPVPPVAVGFVRCANPKRMDDVSLVELGSWNKDPR